MDEKSEKKQKAEEKKPQETEKAPNEDIKKGFQPETVGTLDRADEIAERQKRENDRREELIKRDEALAARKAVGGDIDAGEKKPEKKEETDSEYRKRIEKDVNDGKYN